MMFEDDCDHEPSLEDTIDKEPMALIRLIEDALSNACNRVPMTASGAPLAPLAFPMGEDNLKELIRDAAVLRDCIEVWLGKQDYKAVPKIETQGFFQN